MCKWSEGRLTGLTEVESSGSGHKLLGLVSKFPLSYTDISPWYMIGTYRVAYNKDVTNKKIEVAPLL